MMPTMPKLAVGATQNTLPHVIRYRDGSCKAGQLWALAPLGQWDSSAYWVVPLSGDPHPVRVVRSGSGYVRSDR